jgi:hypothetical protein
MTQKANDYQYDEVGLDFSEEKAIDFSKYYLLSNPFPSVLVPQEAPDIFVDRKEVMRQAEHILRRCLEKGESSVMVVVGDYGEGKTHILNYLRARINATMSTRLGDKGIAAYVTPGRRILDLYQYFMSELGLDFFLSLLRSLPDAEPPRHRLQLETWDVAKQLPAEAERRMKLDFRVALQNLLNPYLRDKSWQWLQGVSLAAADRGEIGVRSVIATDADVVAAFTSVISLTYALDYKVVCILLDELEKVVETSPRRERVEYYDALRHIIDNNQYGLCMIATITRRSWLNLRDHAHPLERRLIRNMDELLPFSDNDALELVRKYLHKGRESYAKHQGLILEELWEEIHAAYHETDAELFPFTEDGVMSINAEQAKGSVGEILRLCGELIDTGYEKGVLYDTEAIEEALREKVQRQARIMIG